MKTMTCRQLGGACEMKFRANSFEEMAIQSKQHGTEMAEKGDQAHLNAMNMMQEQMHTQQQMSAWFESKRREFEMLPEEQ